MQIRKPSEESLLLILQISSIVISFLGSIASILAFPIKPDIEFYLYLIIPFFTMVFIIFSFELRTKRTYQQKLKKATESLHLLNHNLRDKLHNLNSIQPMANERLMTELRTTCREIVNNLCNILSEISGNEICVHIKHFPSDVNENKNIIKEGTVKSLCCCDRTLANNNRKQIGNHPIEKNTHYQMVLTSHLGHFIQDNFPKFVNELHKSGDNFQIDIKGWQNFYGTVVMVPIQY